MTCTDITEFFSHTQNLKILLKNRTVIWTSTFCRLHYKTVASISLKTPPSCLILFRVGKSEQARERKLREKTEERFPLCRHLALGPKLSALGQGRYLRTWHRSHLSQWKLCILFLFCSQNIIPHADSIWYPIMLSLSGWVFQKKKRILFRETNFSSDLKWAFVRIFHDWKLLITFAFQK